MGGEEDIDPFSTFDDDEDLDASMKTYDTLKSNIRKIEQNARAIKRLSERYNSSTEKQQNQAIMQELDDIMSRNSSITRQIKQQLVAEKAANDEYIKGHKGSSVGQWRVNQLNSCTRRFKSSSLEFSTELNTFNATLRNKQKRHIDILDDNKLSEQEKEEMVNDYDRAEAFIQEQFQMVEASDALIDRLAELEEMWMELNVLVTEQGEMLDQISRNVEETRDYVKSATKHLQKAEEKQKCSRKLQLWACCCCLVILVILLIALFAGGLFG